MLDNGTLGSLASTTDVCQRQLSNYVTQFFTGRQLRGVAVPYSVLHTPQDEQRALVNQAWFNLWNRSTLLLQTDYLTEDGLPLLQQLAPDLFGTSAEDAPCQYEHDNASPDVGPCKVKFPDEPDDATREAILQHNMLDMLIYRSSLRIYDLQKRVLLGQ